ncbi:hypothetical protein AAZX31_11G183000 [Glycine max]|uniref:Protein kinase domain-containing protein n=1 Tax=Glycine max TaxID=3847 RepID=A0A0R0HHS7_SOYBN|nr:G-type lectin S-receptor-like serine/threonine-protein kinase At1g11410 [Glycine max]XP_040862977.1 G-type lectin S-receptor-like serine/threonine-protein kinase At1g11410 [Glycine max]KAG4989135.1 hypothetical protein JHK85_032118 [Glycine max]KAG4994724.1 hypothetical protein JHK86_031551 [Glycine max]KAG5124722.1 hypothetical protein JHK82_031459 [Glycine max]KAG5146144.1 hypothetical protein JHK84_031687 [Glycine max]KAH1159628.1 hypothetical protein GYH30_031371 [Glycine max]
MCYGYNTDGGCRRWEAISTCRQFGDVFEKMMGYPNNDNVIIESNVTYGSSDCMASCWTNCSCTGFKNLYHNGTGCIFFLFNSMEGVALDSTQAIFYMLVKKTQRNVTKKWIWRIVVIATALLIISPLIICIAIKKRNIMLEEKKRKRTETEMLDLAVSNESLGIKDLEEDLKLFSYTSVVVAANDFSLENKLGEGGFGPVYKGTLPTGEEVAIKRLSKGSGKGIVEFRNELTLICELQHMNLVQLIGCCIHEEERILMYEYMLTKSLDFYIFGKEYAKVYLIICSMQAHTQGFNIIEGKSFMLGNVA